MVQYYRTPGGLFYKRRSDGTRLRVSRVEYAQAGGAAKKASPKKASPKKSASKKISKKLSKASPKRIPKIQYTQAEQKCLEHVKKRIDELAPGIKDGKYKHMGVVYAISYKEITDKHPECKEFFEREKVRKDKLREERRAARKGKKRAPSKKGSKKRSKKASKKRSKGRSKKASPKKK